MESEASNATAEFGAKSAHYLKVVLVTIVVVLVWLFFLSVPLIVYYATGPVIETELIDLCLPTVIPSICRSTILISV